MGILKINLPSNNYANNPSFVGSSAPFSRPTLVSTPTMSFFSPSGSGIVSSLSRYSLPATFVMYGVNSMVDVAKGLYQKKIEDMEKRKELNLDTPSLPSPSVPDGGGSLAPEPYVPNFPNEDSPTLMDILQQSINVNKELVNAVSNISGKVSPSDFSSLVASVNFVGESLYDVASVNASLVTALGDILIEMTNVIANPTMTIEQIEYKNLELDLLSSIASSLANNSSSVSVNFPDSVGVRLEALTPLQEEVLLKDSYLKDVTIPMAEKDSAIQDILHSKYEKELESITFDLEPKMFDNIDEEIPYASPAELRAIRNAVQAKKYSDENTFEVDEDEYDFMFDIPDLTKLFEFESKTSRLAGVF